MVPSVFHSLIHPCVGKMTPHIFDDQLVFFLGFFTPTKPSPTSQLVLAEMLRLLDVWSSSNTGDVVQLAIYS